MSLRKKTISGFLWSALSQGGKVVVQFITTVILARILSPDDFGLLAIALVFTEFVNIFCDMGVGNAIVQKKDATEEHFSTAVVINIIIGVILMALMILFAPLVSKFYNKPALRALLIVLSFNFIIYALAFIYKAYLTKKMEFKKLAMRDILALIVGCIAGITCAFLGFGVWSLVVQSLCFSFFNLLILMWFSDWNPKFGFSRKAAGDILSFSVHTTASGILLYWTRNLDRLLIGKLLGAQLLGLYSLAYKAMMYPLINVVWLVNRVMFPILSDLQDDIQRSCTAYLKVLQGVAYIIFPMMMLLFVSANEFVLVMYSVKWIEVVPLIRVLCFAGIFQCLSSISGAVFLAQGRTKLKLMIDIVNTACGAAAVIVGLRWGLLGIVKSVSIYTFISSLIIMLMAGRLLKVPSINQFKALFLPTGLSIGVAGVSSISLLINSSAIIKLLFAGVSGGGIYVSFLFLLKVVVIREKKLVLNV